MHLGRQDDGSPNKWQPKRGGAIAPLSLLSNDFVTWSKSGYVTSFSSTVNLVDWSWTVGNLDSVGFVCSFVNYW